MGMYDEIKVPCPECGTIHLAQSKGGDCTLALYTLNEAPTDVLLDVNRHGPFQCERCCTRFAVKIHCVAQVVKE